MPSLIQLLLRTMTPACHPPHLTPALFKSHSQQLPSSRCIESAHPLPCDPRFLAEGASDTALGLLARFVEFRFAAIVRDLRMSELAITRVHAGCRMAAIARYGESAGSQIRSNRPRRTLGSATSLQSGWGRTVCPSLT